VKKGETGTFTWMASLLLEREALPRRLHMKQTPYYRAPNSTESVLTGGATGVSAATLFTPPSPRRPHPVKIVRAASETAADKALDRKRSQ
jgi:hypothetical protein